jgi:hypothetical protein
MLFASALLDAAFDVFMPFFSEMPRPPPVAGEAAQSWFYACAIALGDKHCLIAAIVQASVDRIRAFLSIDCK